MSNLILIIFETKSLLTPNAITQLHNCMMKEKNKNSEKYVPANIVLTEELDEYIDAVIMANTHRSRSDLIRDAVKHYLDEHLDPAVKAGAEAILKTRKKTLQEIKQKGGEK